MKSGSTVSVLRDCERSLRALLADAASAGDYAEVQAIAELARAVAALAAGCEPAAEMPKGAIVAGKPDTAPIRPVKPAKEEYPQFFRRGDELVKVGWSKKDKRRYHHRAPRRVVQATASAVRQAGSRGRSFTGDALLPLKDSDTGDALPAYQIYVALAWLKRLGLVKSIGQRGGYTLPSEKNLDATITAAWPALTEWVG
jgi:hypothetical protein